MWALLLATVVVGAVVALLGAVRRDLRSKSEVASAKRGCHNHTPCCHGCRTCE
jgi:hypothetical protein